MIRFPRSPTNNRTTKGLLRAVRVRALDFSCHWQSRPRGSAFSSYGTVYFIDLTEFHQFQSPFRAPVGKEVVDSIMSLLVEGCCALHPECLPSCVVCFGIHLTPLMFIGFCERSFGIQRQQSVPLPKIQQPDPRPYPFDSWSICRFERLSNPRCHGSMTPTCLVLVLPFRFSSHLVSPIPLTPVHMNVYEGMVRCVSIAPPF